MKRLCIYFSAGATGALVNSFCLWGLGRFGINAKLGIAIAPALTPGFLYPRIVWGGIWAFLFLLPFWKASPIRKGIFLSVFPTLVQLLIVFPYQAGKGFGGLELGYLTPILVIVLNGVWGWATGLVIRLSR